MKTILSLFACWMFVLTPAFSADSFEGRVKMKITSEGKSHDFNYALKGSRMRMDMDAGRGGSVSTIIDVGSGEMTSLMHEQKMYMVMSMPDLAATAKAAADNNDVVLEKTNETEKILGYQTTKYLVKDRDTKEPVQIWAAEGLGSFVNPGSVGGPMGGKRGGGSQAAWEKLVREKGFFPLRTIARDNRGRETRMEVVSLEKEKLSDSLFVPPKDYQKFSMPAGFGGGGFPGFGGGKN